MLVYNNSSGSQFVWCERFANYKFPILGTALFVFTTHNIPTCIHNCEKITVEIHADTHTLTYAKLPNNKAKY